MATDLQYTHTYIEMSRPHLRMPDHMSKASTSVFSLTVPLALTDHLLQIPSLPCFHLPSKTEFCCACSIMATVGHPSCQRGMNPSYVKKHIQSS